MPGLTSESIGSPNDPRDEDLRKDFRESGHGWVCNKCKALTLNRYDAQGHLEWHEQLGG